MLVAEPDVTGAADPYRRGCERRTANGKDRTRLPDEKCDRDANLLRTCRYTVAWRSQLLLHRSSEVVMSVSVSRNPKRLLCRFNLRHKWVRRFNSEGEDYLQCKVGGKDLYDVERAYWLSPA